MRSCKELDVFFRWLNVVVLLRLLREGMRDKCKRKSSWKRGQKPGEAARRLPQLTGRAGGWALAGDRVDVTPKRSTRVLP